MRSKWRRRRLLIDGARLENWGDDGSAVDFVGCHNRLVQNSLLIQT